MYFLTKYAIYANSLSVKILCNSTASNGSMYVSIIKTVSSSYMSGNVPDILFHLPDNCLIFFISSFNCLFFIFKEILFRIGSFMEFSCNCRTFSVLYFLASCLFRTKNSTREHSGEKYREKTPHLQHQAGYL